MQNMIRAIQRTTNTNKRAMKISKLPTIIPTMLYYYLIQYIEKEKTFQINAWVSLTNQMVIQISSTIFANETITLLIEITPTIATMNYYLGNTLCYQRFRKFMYKMAYYYRKEPLHYFLNHMKIYYFSTPGRFKLKCRKQKRKT
jgi:hypothetical protein